MNARTLIVGTLIAASAAGGVLAARYATRRHATPAAAKPRRPQGLAGARPTPALKKAIKAKIDKLQERRDRLDAQWRETMWSGLPEAQHAQAKATYEQEYERLDDALTVLDWQYQGKPPPKALMARVQPDLLKGHNT